MPAKLGSLGFSSYIIHVLVKSLLIILQTKVKLFSCGKGTYTNNSNLFSNVINTKTIPHPLTLPEAAVSDALPPRHRLHFLETSETKSLRPAAYIINFYIMSWNEKRGAYSK